MRWLLALKMTDFKGRDDYMRYKGWNIEKKNGQYYASKQLKKREKRRIWKNKEYLIRGIDNIEKEEEYKKRKDKGPFITIICKR